MNRSTYGSPSEAEKGQITNTRNAVVEKFNGVGIGWSKVAYQNENGDFVMRDYFANMLNVFGVKKEHADQFLVDILKTIQQNEIKPVKKQTYATIAIRAIAKCSLPHLKSAPIERHWDLEINCKKQSPYVMFVNIREGEEHNSVICFVKELLIFAKFINSKRCIVDDLLFKTSSIRGDLNDKELFC